jgi:predicted nucleic acid-binding protein
MNLLFVDTAGWMACADGSDPAYEAAGATRDKWLEREGQLLTTDYVIDETLTLLRLRLSLGAAETWWHSIAASRRVQRELIHEERAERARGIFFRCRNKDFSFTDCTSFALMRELRLEKALTTDIHFRQAGFQMLPR